MNSSANNLTHDSAAKSSEATANPLETDGLEALMRAASIRSYRALSAQAGVSRWQVQQLRLGKVGQMRLAVLDKIAIALNIPLTTLLTRCNFTSARLTPDGSPVLVPKSVPNSEPTTKQPLLQQDSSPHNDQLQQAYVRLQKQLEQQANEMRSRLQSEALQTLESWLVQWPTIVARSQAKADLPAVKILPFVRPVEQLMAEWGVEAIAPIDSQVPYDPQLHQLSKGFAKPGELVRVTHSGQRHNEKLLHRAKVQPLG